MQMKPTEAVAQRAKGQHKPRQAAKSGDLWFRPPKDAKGGRVEPEHPDGN